MNNKEKGIKIQVSRPFETILGVGLQEFWCWTPFWVLLVYPPPPPELYVLVNSLGSWASEVTTFLLLPKIKSCSRSWLLMALVTMGIWLHGVEVVLKSKKCVVKLPLGKFKWFLPLLISKKYIFKKSWKSL